MNPLGTDIKKLIDTIDQYYYCRSRLKIDIIFEKSLEFAQCLGQVCIPKVYISFITHIFHIFFVNQVCVYFQGMFYYVTWLYE